MQVEASQGPIENVDVQAIAVAVFKGEKPDDGFLKKVDELSGGLVKSTIDAEEFSGKEGEMAYFHLMGNDKLKARRLLLVGVGPLDEYKTSSVSIMAGTAVRSLRAKNAKSIAVVPRLNGNAESTSSAAVQGAFISIFDPDKYRTVDKEDKKVDRVVVVIEGAADDVLTRGANAGRIIGESMNFTRDLANEPGAYMTPTDMAERAREVANEFGLSIDVLDEARMEQEGMGSLLSVSHGSDQPAKLIILKYVPANFDDSNTELLAFVGKGVTFDSGGISLKPGENMELMKYDMTGGATVIGAMRAIAQLK
ncbi:MAG TPA: M17 family peptidase N-terminal domain-containing protein, partial [Pyrinomonadaceae bacterium]